MNSLHVNLAHPHSSACIIWKSAEKHLQQKLPPSFTALLGGAPGPLPAREMLTLHQLPQPGSSGYATVEHGDMRHALPLLDHPAAFSASSSVLAFEGPNATSLQARGARPSLYAFQNATSGRWARLIRDAEGVHGLYFTGEELLLIRGQAARRRATSSPSAEIGSSVVRFAELPRSPAWHALDWQLRAHRSAEAEVQSEPHGKRQRRRLACPRCPPGPPYGRLPGCPPAGELRVLRMGFVLDAGFAAAAGGSSPALSELASMLHLLNGLYEDQLGLRLEATYVRVQATDGSTSFAEGGPNGGQATHPRRDPPNGGKLGARICTCTCTCPREGTCGAWVAHAHLAPLLLVL